MPNFIFDVLSKKNKTEIEIELKDQKSSANF